MGMKKQRSDLALFGGNRLFAEGNERHVGKPTPVDKRALLARWEAILDSARLTNNGPVVREFEERIADYLKVRYVVAVSSGTTGLQIAAKAMGAKRVIVPAFTFPATAQAMSWIGAKPILCDVDRQTGQMNMECAVWTANKVDADLIVPVHLFGNVVRVGDLRAELDIDGGDENILVDASHAFGCSADWQFPAVMSTHATKALSTIEGGLIITNDAGMAQECRLLRNFCFAGVDDCRGVGINGKLSEVHAAYGLESLRAFRQTQEANFWRRMWYFGELGAITGVRILPIASVSSCHYFVIDVSGFAVSRDVLCEALWAEGVLARRYFYPGLTHLAETVDDMPGAAYALRNFLTLPTGPQLSMKDVADIASVIRVMGGAA